MIECNYCKKMFEPSKYQQRQFNKNIAVYCSRACSTASRYGNSGVITDEIVENIRQLFETTTMSYDDIQKVSNLSKNVFAETVKKYNLGRSKETSNKLRIENMRNTMLEKYGVANAMELQEFRDNIRIAHSNRTAEQKISTTQKSKQTRLKRYGDENYHNVEQTKKTMKEKYGVTSGFLTETSVKNRIETSMKKYGVRNPLGSKQVRDLGKQVIKQKYGVEYALQSDVIRIKAEKTNKRLYGNINAFKNKEIQQRQFKTMKEKYGVAYGCLTDNCANASPKAHSEPNERFKRLLCPDRCEVAVENYRYDMLKGDTLIEVDPTHTHNIYKNPFGKPKSKNYHLNKTNTAICNGYNCIHIFDWDDWRKIKYMLQEKQTLYARNLELKEVSIENTADFLNEYHLQGNCRGQEIRLGLYKNNELIEIMTFGKPRYNKNYEWELLRLCTHKDYKVVGGAEKLFKAFLTKYKPVSIISYCDFSKFTGSVYERLGFKQKGKITPSKHWSKNSEHITDNLLRQRGYDQLFNTNYGKGTSNEELMLENGWLPIYDCGQVTYTWHVN